MATDQAVKSAEEKWWDWLSPSRGSLPDDASDMARREFCIGLVKRCVLVESLSPWITTQILLAAIDQFATVRAIKLLRPPVHLDKTAAASGVIPNHSRMAVVELEDHQKADVVVTQPREYLLMLGGMPRSPQAHRAKAAMLVDHPCNRRRILVNLKIVKSTDPQSRMYIKKRRTFVEHLKGATFLHECQEREEEELHREQQKNCTKLKEKCKRIKNDEALRDLRNVYNLHPRR